MPDEALDQGSIASETPADTSGSTTEPAASQFTYPEDRSSWVRPEVVQRLWEDNQRYKALGDHEDLKALREREKRLIEAVAPSQGRKWTQEQQEIRQAWRSLHPEWEHASKLTPDHIALLDHLGKYRDQLDSLGDLRSTVQEMRAAQTGQAVGVVRDLAKRYGLNEKAATRVESAISHEIQSNPRALDAFLRGDAEMKAKIAAHFAPQVLQDLYGERRVEAQANLQGTKEAVAGLPAPTTRGAPAGSTPSKRIDETDLKDAHSLAFAEVERLTRG